MISIQSFIENHLLEKNVNRGGNDKIVLKCENIYETRYFKGRNFRGQKISRFCGFLPFSRKLKSAKFFRIGFVRKLIPAKWKKENCFL